MNIPLVDLASQYQEIKKETDEKILATLKKGDYILGQNVDNFEAQFAKYCQTKFAIGVASGYDAILLALQSLGVGPGDEVITQANTFISTVLPILDLGAKVVLVDINPDDYQIDLQRVEKAINKNTKVIMPVHLYGIPAPMPAIMKLAKKYHLQVVEDACQAHGASLNKKRCGSFGTLAAFSFYPGKNLGGVGDGGAVVTNQARLAKIIKSVRNIGQTKKYVHDLRGRNSRLDTLNAGVLEVKLKHLENWNSKRRQMAKLYCLLLSDLPEVILPLQLDSNYLVNYHLFVIRVKNRARLMAFLDKAGVHTGIHYPIPIHLQKSMIELGYKAGDFPITEEYAKEILSLPIYPQMTPEQVKYVCEKIKEFYAS